MPTLSKIEQNLDPFPVYRAMRKNQPVYYDPERNSWNVFCYDDVQRVLSDYTIFSSQFGSQPGSGDDLSQPFAASMISTDPPRHRKLRALVTQAFTPRAVEALAPRIRAIVDAHLDGVISAGRMDVIRDLGDPLPVIVIAELLGIPAGDRERFKKWSDWIVQTASMAPLPLDDGDGSGMSTGFDESLLQSDAVQEMSMYFFDMIEKRRVAPEDDLISGLLQANIDGETLSLIELLGFCSLLLVAGNETTTNLLGNAFLCFTDEPKTWQKLRERPDLLPQAIEEILRYRSPVQSMFRVAKVDTVVAGQRIPAGATVMPWIGSANRDETQFPDPDRFDIERSPNRHLAFGNGIHYCLGAPLARLEARIALGAMLERFSTISAVEDAILERLPSLIVYGVRGLPIRFASG